MPRTARPATAGTARAARRAATLATARTIPEPAPWIDLSPEGPQASHPCTPGTRHDFTGVGRWYGERHHTCRHCGLWVQVAPKAWSPSRAGLLTINPREAVPLSFTFTPAPEPAEGAMQGRSGVMHNAASRKHLATKRAAALALLARRPSPPDVRHVA